jgi:hypothetical protein
VMEEPFPDLAFVGDARKMEEEAIQPGIRAISLGSSLSIANNVIPSTADIEETERRIRLLKEYVPHAQQAYRDRGLTYPFDISASGDCLVVLPGQETAAQTASELSMIRSQGGQVAKAFEVRACRALHRLIGGWAACVGAPRLGKKVGTRKAVEKFRGLLGSECSKKYKKKYPPNSDMGADAFWILGRDWGGPLVYLQAKNMDFDMSDAPPEFQNIGNVVRHWFGRSLDLGRSVLSVLAVNTVVTLEMKHHAFQCCGPGKGYHLIDAVDILHAESLPSTFVTKRDVLVEL